MMTLSEHFERKLRDQNLIVRGDKVFVACSGGPDSVALFHLLYGLRETWNLKLGLLHFHHGLRGREADRDERFVQALARRYGVPVHCARKKVLRAARKDKESIEEAARKARYDFFVRVARRRHIAKVASAHTLNDQAETVLMRLLQGTGLRGLSGIQRRMEVGGVTFVRPLLQHSKREILNYLRKKKIPFCRDRSNQSVRFLRNRIRRKLLPWLVKEFNPRTVEAIARLPVIVEEANSLLAEMEEAAYQKAVRRKTKNKVFFDRNVFLKSAPVLQFGVLHRALRRLDPRSGMDFETWQRIKTQLGQKRVRYSLPRDIDLFLSPSEMIICKKFAQRF